MILIQHILQDSRKRLAVLSREASVCEAAAILVDRNMPLVVVCDEQGVAVGVVSRTDIIKAIAGAGVAAAEMNTGAIMANLILSCHVDEAAQSVWENMNARSLRAAPILDDAGRPLGVVHARDLARALLDEVTKEEGLLRDYVMGVGYQ